MTYIKLTDEMNLVVTKAGEIYRGDNMSSEIIFVVPTYIDSIEVAKTTVLLSYIRPDGTPDIVALDPSVQMYNPNYHMYTLPVTCKLSRCHGYVYMWLQFYCGDPSQPIVKKSGGCTIHIRESKNIDDCLHDHQLTAIYQIKKMVEEMNNSSGGSGDEPGDNAGTEFPGDESGFPSVEF